MMPRIVRDGAIACLILLLSINFKAYALAPESCISGYTYSDVNGRHCYRYVSSRRTWSSASSYCSAEGGTLATLATEAEVQLGFALCQDPNKACWTGLNKNSGSWRWQDGTSFSNNEFASGYPAGGAKYCVRLWTGSDPNLKYINEGCSASRRFLCRQPAGCPPGKYRSGNNCYNCPAGKYNSAVTSSGSGSCQQCPPGRYGSSSGLTSSDCSGACLKGYYCPSGSTRSTQKACPAGRYGSSAGLQTSDCSGPIRAGYYGGLSETSVAPSGQLCAAGRYGDSGQTSSSCSGPCSSGYYCFAGANTAQENTCGDSTKYCPSGSSSPKTVSSGYYTLPESGSTRSDQAICPTGYYCTSGVRRPCPRGRYGSQERETSSQCEGPCSPGFVCPEGSSQASQEACGIGNYPANYYCPGPSISLDRRTVSSGYYSTPESAPESQRTGQQRCADNYVCENGKRARKIQFDPSDSSSSDSDNDLCSIQIGSNSFNGGVWSISEFASSGDVLGNIGLTSRVGTLSFSSVQQLDPSTSITPIGPCQYSTPFAISRINSNDARFFIKSGQSLNYETCPQFKIKLSASSSGQTVDCTFTVEVIDENDAPSFPQSSYRREISEFASVNDAVGDPVEANDEDIGQELRYKIISGNEDGLFGIGSCSGQIFVVDASLSYEMPVRDPHYILTVRATDNGTPSKSTTTEARIFVLDEPEPPFFTADPYVFSVSEAANVGHVVGTVTADDPDYNTELTWTMVLLDGESTNPPFSIESSTGKIVVAGANLLDYRKRTSYRARVTVTDGTFDVTASSVLIEIEDANQPPYPDSPDDATSPSDTPYRVQEMSMEGTTIGPPFQVVDIDDQSAADENNNLVDCTVTGTYSDRFAINKLAVREFQFVVASGVSSDVLNFLEKSFYLVQLECADNGYGYSAPASRSYEVGIALIFVNKPPTISDVTFFVSEKAALNALVGSGSDFDAQDPDPGQRLAYSIVSNGVAENLFSIDRGSGDIRLRQSGALNYTVTESYTFQVMVEDNGDPVLSASASTLVRIQNANDKPIIPSGQLLQVFENSAAHVPLNLTGSRGDEIGHLLAWDPDGADQTQNLVWTIEWAPISTNESDLPTIPLLFEINNEGIISMAENADTNVWTTHINHEGTSPYTSSGETGLWKVRVTVTDPGLTQDAVTIASDPLHASSIVSINVLDIKEAPRLDWTSRSVPEQSPAGTQVGSIPIQALDQDDGQQDNLKYYLEDGLGNGNLFLVATDGVITLGEEAPQVIPEIHGMKREFNISVRVVDPDGLEDVTVLSMYVTYQNYAPVMTAQSFNVDEDQTPGIVSGRRIQFTDSDEGQDHTFFVNRWRPARAQSMMSVDSSTGDLIVLEDGLNFEDVEVIEMDVVVEDDGAGHLTAAAVITVNVGDVNESPRITTKTLSVHENVPLNTLVGTINVWDQDAGDTHTFRINSITPQRDDKKFPFAIDNISGSLSTAQEINYEDAWLPLDAKFYNVNITTTDTGGLTNTKIVRVDILDINERPFISRAATSYGDFWFQVSEGSGIGSNVLALYVHTSQLDWNDYDDANSLPSYITIQDPDHSEYPRGRFTFAIVAGNEDGHWIIDASSGQLQVAGDIDYENIDNYNLTVRITDGDVDTPLSLDVTAIIVVNNVNDIQVTHFNQTDNFDTRGGAVIELTGVNFGPTQRKLDNRDATMSNIIVTAYCGRDNSGWGPEFISPDCEIVEPNTRMQCIVPPGVGIVRWSFTIDDSDTMTFGNWSVTGTNPPNHATQLLSVVADVHAPADRLAYKQPEIHSIFVYTPTSEMTTSDDLSEISVRDPRGLDTRGGQTLIIVGDYFGPSKDTQFVQVSQPMLVSGSFSNEHTVYIQDRDGTHEEQLIQESYDLSSCTLLEAHEAIKCTTPAGIGTSLTFDVTVGAAGTDNEEIAQTSDSFTPANDQDSTSLANAPVLQGFAPLIATRYAPPRVVSVAISSNSDGCKRMNTRGEDTIKLSGTQFGPINSYVSAFAVQFASNSSTTLMPAYQVSMAESVVLDLRQPVLALSAVDCSVSRAHEEITCKTSPGIGQGFIWHVAVGEQQSTVAESVNASVDAYETILDISTEVVAPFTTSFSLPRIIDIEGAGAFNADTTGGQSVILAGDQFGPPASIQTTEQYEKQKSDWDQYSSDTRNLWRISSAQRAKWFENIYSVRAYYGRSSTVQTTASAEEDALCSAPFTVRGESSARFTLLDCVVQSHAEIECLSQTGTGTGFVYAVTIGEQGSLVYDGVESTSGYHPPIISYYRSSISNQGPDASVSADPFDTRGHEIVYIEGLYFGPTSDTLQTVTYGQQLSQPTTVIDYDGNSISIGGPDEFVATNCSVVSPNTRVQCYTVEGAGDRLAWIVRVDGQRSVSPTTSYDSPHIDDFSGTAAIGASTMGGETIYLHGLNFGPKSTYTWSNPREPSENTTYTRALRAPSSERFLTSSAVRSYTFLEWVKYGPTGYEYDATDCKALNHTTIECTTAPGSGSNFRWRARVEGQTGSLSTSAWSYAAPEIRSVSPDHGATSGSVLITVTGRNFGTLDPKTVAFVRFAKWNQLLPTRNARRVMNNGELLEQIDFVLPQGAGVNRTVEVVLRMSDAQRGTSADDVYSNSALFDYDPPTIDRLEVLDNTGEEANTLRVLVHGESLGSSFAVGFITFMGVVIGKEPYQTTGTRIRSWNNTMIVIISYDLETEMRVYTAKQVTPGHPDRGFPTPIGIGSIGNKDKLPWFESREVVLIRRIPSFTPAQLNALNGPNAPQLPTAGGFALEFYVNQAGEDINSTEVTIGEPQIYYYADDVRYPVYPEPKPIICDLLESPELLDESAQEYRIVCRTPPGQGLRQPLRVAFKGQTSSSVEVNYAAPNVTGLSMFYPRAQAPVEQLCCPSEQTADLADTWWSSLLLPDGTMFDDVAFATANMARSSLAEVELDVPDQALGAEVSVLSDGAGSVSYHARIPTYGALLGLHGLDMGLIGFFQGYLTADVPTDVPLLQTTPQVVLSDSSSYDNILSDWASHNTPIVHFDGSMPPFTKWQPTSSNPNVSKYTNVLSTDMSHEHAFVMLPAGVQHASGEVSGNMIQKQSALFSRTNTGSSAFGYPLTEEVAPAVANLVASLAGGSISISYVVGVPGQSSQDWVSGPTIEIEYAPPTLFEQAITAPTYGGSLVVIRGTNFGNSSVTMPQVSIGGLDCRLLLRNVTIPSTGSFSESWILARSEPDPHTTIFCVAPVGDGADRTVTVTVGAQSITANTSLVNFSYDPPTVTSVEPPVGPTAGNIIVTITGTNFGLNSSHGSVILRANPATYDECLDYNVRVSQDDILFWNHTHIRFYLPEGQGNTKKIDVIVAGQSSLEQTGGYAATASHVNFDYEYPIITGVDRRCPTTGCYISITGENFGKPACSSESVDPVRIRSPSVDSDWDKYMQLGRNDSVITFTETVCRRPVDGTYTHTEIVCLVNEGFGENLQITVQIGDKLSNVANYSYMKAEVKSISPNTANALADPEITLRIRGENFGPTGPPVEVYIGGVECLNARVLTSHSQISCALQPDTVGTKNVSVFAALQENSFDQSQRLIALECQAGYYGQPDEVCLACPPGAQCLRPECQEWDPNNVLICDAYQEPTALPGFWRSYVSTADNVIQTSSTEKPLPDNEVVTESARLCAPERLHRPGRWDGQCPVFVKCDPEEACVGNNRCAPAYAGHRCSKCSDKHFRFDGECRQCPDNSWVLIVVFVVGIIFVAAGGYMLNKKQINLAFVTIGIDYFQVLAMFARSRVRWPQFIRDLFSALSVFNLNLDLSAPECAMPSLGYETKWFAVMLLPLCIIGVFGVLHVAKYCYKRFILKVQSAKRNAHLPILIGASFTTLYFLYLYLTRTVFDVFNCSPLNPDDGYSYMQAVFVPCYVSGGLQMFLLPFAIVAMVVYVVAYPATVMYILWRNKDTVKVDQLLRARGFGAVRHLSNNACYVMRKKYQKLYYSFKPGKWYWIGLIITRKFGISVTALLFRSSPAFQMAMALMVLFGAFSLQVRHSPFMSTSEFSSQWLWHTRKVQAGDRKHMKLDAELKEIFRKTRNKGKRSDMKSILKQHTAGPSSTFTNHNTVESVLLGCAMMVALSGVMFQSKRFEEGKSQDGYNALVVLVMILIISSLCYFAFVAFAELSSGLCPIWFTNHCKRLQSKKTAIELEQAQLELLGQGDDPKDADTMLNPMMTSKKLNGEQQNQLSPEELQQVLERLDKGEPPNALQWTAIRRYLEGIQGQIGDMSTEMRKLKRQNNIRHAQTKPVQPTRMARKQKVQFGQQSTAPNKSFAQLVSANSRRKQRPGGQKAPTRKVFTFGESKEPNNNDWKNAFAATTNESDKPDDLQEAIARSQATKEQFATADSVQDESKEGVNQQ